jgi:transposase, IS5 family
MKNINVPGLFDDHFLMDKLTKLGDPLQRLNNYIDWEVFRDTLEKAFETEP